MGKKKTVTITRSEREIPDDDAEISVPEVDVSADDLDGLLGLNSGGHRYTVHKEPSAPGGKRQYCCTYTAEELSLDAIRDDYGGGAYRITGFDEKNRLTTSKRVDILEPIKPPVPREPGEYLARGERSSSEAMNMLVKMFEAQSATLNALLSRPAPAPPPGTSLAELLTLVKAMQPATGDPVKTLLDGLKLGRELGGGGGETGILDVAMKGFEAVTALQANAPHAAPTPQPAQPQRLPHPSPPITPQPAPANAAPEKTREEMSVIHKLNWLQKITADLCARAARGSDPELYADVMMDNLPAFITEEEIFERMSAPDAVAQLVKLHPPVAAHMEWFEHFRKAVLDSFDEEPEGGDVGGGGELEP